MPEITSAFTGDSPILSYALYWDSGTGSFSSIPALVGASSPNLVRIYVTGTLSTLGVYWFYYVVQNAHGWSDPSPITEIKNAKKPNSPSQPVVVSSATVDISWVLDTVDMNGDDVISYQIYIQTSNPLIWQTETTYCDGSNAAILSSKSCSIPFEVLWADPF